VLIAQRSGGTGESEQWSEVIKNRTGLKWPVKGPLGKKLTEIKNLDLKLIQRASIDKTTKKVR